MFAWFRYPLLSKPADGFEQILGDFRAELIASASRNEPGTLGETNLLLNVTDVSVLEGNFTTPAMSFPGFSIIGASFV